MINCLPDTGSVKREIDLPGERTRHCGPAHHRTPAEGQALQQEHGQPVVIMISKHGLTEECRWPIRESLEKRIGEL